VTQPKFGHYLRASRLGFKWVNAIERYVRVYDWGDNWVIETCTPEAIIGKKIENREFRCWWEGEHGSRLEKLAPALYDFQVLSRAHTIIVVDNDGNRVRQPAACEVAT